VGSADAVRGGAVVAGPGRRARGGQAAAVGAVGVPVVQQRVRYRSGGVGGEGRRSAGPGRRPGEPRPVGAEGAVRVAGTAARPVGDRSGAQLRRGAGGDPLRRGDGGGGAPLPGAAGPGGAAVARLLHLGSADARGVLHAGGDWEGRHRYPAHGRQHPAVHGHRCGGAEGDLRGGRAARLLHRRRPHPGGVPMGAQHGRDADRAVVADPGPHPRGEPPGAGGRGPAVDPGGAGGVAHRWGAPARAHRHQPGRAQRAAARGPRPR